MNQIGVMQGRLLPKYKGRYQAHPKDTWQDEFFLAQKLGLDLVEFIFDYDDFVKNPLFSANGIRLIKKIIKESKVGVKTVCADFFMDQPIHSVDKKKHKESKAVLKNLIKFCSELNVSDIIIPCVDNSSLKNKKDINVFVETISEFGNLLEKFEINLSLETDLAPTEFLSLLNKFSSKRITVNYDIGNSACKGFNYLEELSSYGKRITDVHIKDRILGGASVYLGMGNANFDGVFKSLKSLPYKGPLIMQAYRDENGLEIFKKQYSWIKKKLKIFYEN